MPLATESPPRWQPRPRIRPKRSQSSSISNEQYPQHHYYGSADAKTHGPSVADSGLVAASTRSLKLLFTSTHENPPSPSSAVNSISVSSSSGRHNFDSPSPAASSDPAAPSASQSVQPALLPPLFPPTPGIPIRREYVFEMSRKPKRQSKSGSGGGGGDIMDSLVSSIDAIESKQMRGFSLSNGHRRQRSESIGSVTSVAAAPVIQTSKTSARNPKGTNKLSRKPSVRRSTRETNGRHPLRSSSSQEQWLPPIEQEDDIFSVPSARRSSNSNNFPRHPSIPARTTSITHEILPPQIPQRANSLLPSSVPPPSNLRPSQPRRSENFSDIPSYITRYLHERVDSKENLAVEVPLSPRRSAHASRNLPGRSRNSTTVIPGNDQYPRLKILTKRQSSQGFERDMSATRYYYSLPPNVPNTPRRSASLNPSRSSLASDSSNAFSKFTGNYVQEVLSNPKLTQRIRLTNGRILSFSEVGDENGWPVFCFTGMGLNRLVAAFYDEVATSFGLRIITPDRPGIGLSDDIRPSPKKVLAWADDITEICQALSIENFSLLGHSLGGTYALAVALRLPERIRGQIHLLAPWIPLSQVNAATAMFDDIAIDSSCMSFPATHRFLRVLPVPIIKVAGNFLKEKEYDGKSNGMTSPREARRSTTSPTSRTRTMTMSGDMTADSIKSDYSSESPVVENDLVAAIWAAATRDANATVDLLTSLERPHTVGFTYFDVTLPMVIRHGSKDERVPLERVIWMTKAMNMAREKNAELKIIQGAQHGLMARADVMSDVFEELAQESHKWDGCVRCRKGEACWLASNFKEGPSVSGKDRSKRR